jgi:hypothetical protein
MSTELAPKFFSRRGGSGVLSISRGVNLQAICDRHSNQNSVSESHHDGCLKQNGTSQEPTQTFYRSLNASEM